MLDNVVSQLTLLKQVIMARWVVTWVQRVLNYRQRLTLLLHVSFIIGLFLIIILIKFINYLVPPLRPELELLTRPRNGAFEVDQQLKANCISRDGRPAANITWFLGNFN